MAKKVIESPLEEGKGIIVVAIAAAGDTIVEKLQHAYPGIEVVSTRAEAAGETIDAYNDYVANHFNEYATWVFIGAAGIATRLIAASISDKKTDPAVLVIDSMGQFVIPILSGHVGGANKQAQAISGVLGATPIITTQSDLADLWALDTLPQKYNWEVETVGATLNDCITRFVQKQQVALWVDVRDRGTMYMEQSCPEHVSVYTASEDIPADTDLIIAVSARYISQTDVPVLYYRPKVLLLGVGCTRDSLAEGVDAHILAGIKESGWSPLSVANVSTIDLKKEEALVHTVQESLQASLTIYEAKDLQGIEVPNPSEHVRKVTGVAGVAEACVLKASNHGALCVEKQKGSIHEGHHFTWALAMDRLYIRAGHIEFVGAGPGDPDLVSVRGRQFLETADLILYAGSLVPRALTQCHKSGAVVKSSAGLNLEEQFALMQDFYNRGLLVVRLHTGDPCIYGAIQEQMALMDEAKMRYHITPGISSFQAAAAELQSQFTIPEKVQTIILTRGEGRTAMPEDEKLHLLARSQSTMCIFLSAGIVDDVQSQLLQHYPPTTPVAACYKLTWPDQRIYRGELQNLAQMVKENNLTLTTMIVVGEAIDNRKGLSRLYADEFKHLFRT